MKRLILLLALLPIVLFAKEKTPEWMTSRVSETSYVGVGSCSMSDTNWQSIAEQNALSDMIQQISVLIEKQSFLMQMEADNDVRELFKQTISSSSKNLFITFNQVFRGRRDCLFK